MEFKFFIFLIAAIALGVYIGKDPTRNINNLVIGFFRSIPGTIMAALLLGCLYYSFLISYSILEGINNSTTAPVPSFLIPIAAGFIAIVLTIWLGRLIFNIKSHGLIAGIKKSLKELESDKPKK